ncbi:peroxide stress protein YaaA [Candidatus Peregrinibacteria bacterium]|nr:MAG: peroxide stress protein YaaA [Candidatus Peregrinibacteria bacterium]
MIFILSPSKTQDFDTPAPVSDVSQPRFLKQSEVLVKELKKLSEVEIGKLMSISDKLAALNYGRYHRFTAPFKPSNSKSCLWAFRGDVYDGMNVDHYSRTEVDYAQTHLRIFSGLYGLMRPLDLMQPYRLEMKTKLKNPKGKDLYDFWGHQLTDQLQADLKANGDDVLINLASQEYWKVIQPASLNARIITPKFMENKNGDLKMIALFAKKARGLMADYSIQNQLKDPEALKSFSVNGYQLNSALSSADEWVFVR